ncbi:hypothetical protein EPVG_00010 [Emiliania huxleyi virus 201]|nr:hypothetical protein ELVG_00180 [Emiliania huxleyi virus 203]AEP15839.1 hypothetical protein EQVG_00430 [Emiliania huxleyi virus 207]AEP16252.1 hypothetical protein ERVG_00379 [Emiliania huxleyi virus 208]AET97898.1 hypothetical protein EPVG_00010 [Emiliania huxleyi virus 201]
MEFHLPTAGITAGIMIVLFAILYYIVRYLLGGQMWPFSSSDEDENKMKKDIKNNDDSHIIAMHAFDVAKYDMTDNFYKTYNRHPTPTEEQEILLKAMKERDMVLVYELKRHNLEPDENDGLLEYP